MFLKLGEAFSIRPSDLQPLDKLSSDIGLDIETKMTKFAEQLKVIAPQAKDFLYFTCVMMHAAEASLVNDDGSPKKMSNGKLVTATWETHGEDSIKWSCSDKSILPYRNSNCFVPGTKILMSDGSVKNIEDVVIGDEVITHKNRTKKVTKTFVNQYDGDLINFKIANGLPITCTPEHPFFTVKTESKDKTLSRALQSKYKYEFDFVNAEKFNKSGLFLSPVLKDYVPSDLNKNKARLLGLFAAEGSCHRNEVIFSFGSHEENTIAELATKLIKEEFDIIARKRIFDSKCEISFSSKVVCEFFKKNVGLYSYGKKLSKELVYGSEEVKKSFIIGWLEGDGDVDKYSGKLGGTTVSPDLASQVRVMLNSLYINNTLQKFAPKSSLLASGRLIQGKHDTYRVKIPHNEGFVFVDNSEKLKKIDKDIKFVKIFRFIENYRIHKILSRNYIPYSGSVYNIEVEDDHSYVANNIIVHNCDIFPEHELKKAYKNWVGRPLCLDHQSQSVDKIRGVIVDTVYDEPRHRIIALCALDKKNYPDLADKVTTGVSKDVSMGVSVGKAICSDCGKPARTEREFCVHMKNRTRYGEINTELSPIELSLVVNGADKKAKVKHIIASDVSKAAELLTDYLQLKEAANKVSTNDLESIKEELSKLTEKVTGLINDSGNEDDESDAIGPTRSKTNWAESIISDSTQFNVPEAIPTYASALQVAILGAQTKIASLQENLLRLSKSEESTMSTKNAYFQGTEEPKPGQKQYAVDPLNEKARELDKNLVNITNTGNDGMFPGDEQKKKDLLRLADEHERALFREAALKKAKETLMSKAYMQGTEEPKSGKGPTYTPDPLEVKDRALDKQMQGKAPFPNTGKVEELFPGDLQAKKDVCRASLKARFEKVAMPDGRVNRGASRWIVIANEQPILSATVDQITKGNTDALYDAVATQSFGKSILTRIQQDGFEATASSLLQKSAQAAPPAPAPAPIADFGGEDITPPADVTGEEADPAVIVEQLNDLTNEMQTKLDDLNEKVVGPVKEDAENLGGVPAAGDEAFAMPDTGAVPAKSASQLMGMRKRVNAMLQDGIADTTASLEKHIKEIKTASSVYEQSYTSMTEGQRDYLNQLTVEAVKDARAMLNDTNKLMEAVVKYAYGTAELEKRAQMTDVEKKNLGQTLDQEAGAYVDQLAGRTPSVRTPADSVGGSNIGKVEKADPDMAAALRGLSDAMNADDSNIEKIEKADPEVAAALKGMGDAMKGGDKAKADDNDLKLKPAGDDTFEVVNASTKEERAMLRAKLAEKAQNLGFNALSDQAHPGGSVSAVDAGNLSTKPSIEAGFHVAKDIKEEMLGLATMPPKVRKQAEAIQSLVAEGKLAVEDVDSLVSHGVDGDAVKYWKAMWGQAKDKESSEFASKLTTEHVKAAAAEEKAEFQGKIKRAYEMANAMLSRGMIAESQVDSQVGEIMKWNDAGFESFKNIVSRSPMVRQASVPMVGLTESSFLVPSTSFEKTASSKESDLVSIFTEHFDSLGSKNRMF